MKLFKRKKLASTGGEVPWGVEYRLRMLHMANPQGKCSGCYAAWDKCPTLRILEEHWVRD